MLTSCPPDYIWDAYMNGFLDSLTRTHGDFMEHIKICGVCRNRATESKLTDFEKIQRAKGFKDFREDR